MARNGEIQRVARQQAQLGIRQAQLAHRQEAVQARASSQVDQVIARALASGKAERL